jgi:hypothetical protein
LRLQGVCCAGGKAQPEQGGREGLRRVQDLGIQLRLMWRVTLARF